MKPIYRIKDWERFFETNESRKVVNARWVPMPNKQDGKGYRRVAQHKNGVAIFCAWTLILEVASKMPNRGTLADHDGPLDAEDLAVKTGFPARIFEQALEFLTDTRVGWLAVAIEGPATPAEPAGVPSCTPDEPAASRVEGNGTEGHGTEGQDNAQAPDSPPFTSLGFLATLGSFEQHRKEIRKPLKPTGRRSLYKQLEGMGEQKAIAAMEASIANGWQGVFEQKNGSNNGTNTQDNGLRRASAAERNNEQLKRNLAVVEKLRRESGGDSNEVEGRNLPAVIRR